MKKITAGFIIIGIIVVIILYALFSAKSDEIADENEIVGTTSAGVVSIDDGNVYAEALQKRDPLQCERIINLPLKSRCIEALRNNQ